MIKVKTNSAVLALSTTAQDPLPLSRYKFEPLSSPEIAARPAALRERALRSLEQLEGLTSVEDVREHYGNRSNALRRLRSEWDALRQKAILDSDKLPASDRIQPISLALNGAQYNIYGIFHSTLLPPSYMKSVAETIRGGGSWLSEQNLISYILRVYRDTAPALELPDHNIGGPERFSKIEQFFGALTLDLPPRLARYFPGRRVRELEDRHRPNCPLALDRNIAEILHENPLRLLKNSHLIGLRHFPDPLSISLTLEQGRDLNPVTLRSAYMAEMLRGWQIDGDKNILVGAAHAKQIAYFLENPLVDAHLEGALRQDLPALNDSFNKSNVLWRTVKRPLAFRIGQLLSPPAFWAD